jgi:glycyl-tRNA synthetase beta chain
VPGALVALADRIDTLVGCFAVGLVPSGSADPFGLRRAAIGVLAILLDRGQGGAQYSAQSDLPTIDGLIGHAVQAYGDTLAVSEAALEQLREFFRSRLRSLLVEDGIDAQAVEVALGIGINEPSDARIRANHLARVPQDVRAAFKRIGNILDDAKAKSSVPSGNVDPARFASKDGAEARLWSAFRERQDRLTDGLAKRQYDACFEVLAEIGPEVAAFFDKGGVMVMDPDLKLRDNRLSLLKAIHEPFVQIGDFRKLGAS